MTMSSLAMFLQWAGCVFGVSGAALLAIHNRYSRYGWPLFLVSNVFWIGFALERSEDGLLVQQGFFTATSLLGLYRWWLRRGPDPVTVTRNLRQRAGLDWALRCFGAAAAHNHDERVRRFAEEALELAQSARMSEEAAIDLVRYVYSRPAGELTQEVGGVSLSLLNLCEFVGVSADECELRELNRVLSKDPAYFRARQNAKALAGVASPATEVPA